jgi:hypothetical protein
MTSAFGTFIRPRLLEPVPEPVRAMAHHVRSKYADVCAILAYGSTLRDADPSDTLIDLYVLTANMQSVSTNALSRLGCALLPPNVYYAECHVGEQTYRGKYAVLSMSQLAVKLGHSVSNPYFWARFAQPVRLVWSRDAGELESVVKCLARASATAYANAKGSLPAADTMDQWSNLFRETYGTELRPESAGRAQQIVAANAYHFEQIAKAFADVPPIQPHWFLRRMAGKTLSVLRLVKAAFTFQGGADYIAWKIKRHAGVEIEVTEFQRRHPLLAGLLLLPQLLRKGAVR